VLAVRKRQADAGDLLTSGRHGRDRGLAHHRPGVRLRPHCCLFKNSFAFRKAYMQPSDVSSTIQQLVKGMPGRGVGKDPNKPVNRVRIGGVQRRCMFVSLADLWKWQKR
jgi:hypothetical protein